MLRAVGDRFDELATARDIVLAEAEALRTDLEPALEDSLRVGLQRLLQIQVGHLAALDAPTRRALDAVLETAVPTAVAAVIARLREPDVWLSPLVAPDLPTPEPTGWPLDAPGWLVRLAGRGGRARVGLGAMDDPGNRIWVAVCSAAASIDPVLVEFGFEPSRRRIGGGRFGVVPRTLPALNPSGILRQRWKRYRAAFGRYEALGRVRG